VSIPTDSKKSQTLPCASCVTMSRDTSNGMRSQSSVKLPVSLNYCGNASQNLRRAWLCLRENDMLTDYAARVVGIVGITLRKGETPDDDVCLLEVLLADGTYASTWWDIGPDWREETKGRRVVAIQRASFRR